jgi:hypothetical protein
MALAGSTCDIHQLLDNDRHMMNVLGLADSSIAGKGHAKQSRSVQLLHSTVHLTKGELVAWPSATKLKKSAIKL